MQDTRCIQMQKLYLVFKEICFVNYESLTGTTGPNLCAPSCIKCTFFLCCQLTSFDRKAFFFSFEQKSSRSLHFFNNFNDLCFFLIDSRLFSRKQGYDVQRHFQQYFSYIMAVSFIGEGNRVPGENHRTVASH